MIGLAHAVDLLEIQVSVDLRCQRAQIASVVCWHGNVLRDVSHDSASVYAAAMMRMVWALRVVVVSTLMSRLFRRRAETCDTMFLLPLCLEWWSVGVADLKHWAVLLPRPLRDQILLH